MRRRLHLRLLTLLAVLAVALPLGAWPRVQYFCRMLDRVMPACCCARAAAARPPAEGTQIRAADCCERLSAGLGRGAPAALDDAGKRHHALGLATALPPILLALLPAAHDVAPGVASVLVPLGQGPPLFLKNCSLLT